MKAVEALLREGLSEMGLALPPSAMDQLIRYLELVRKWNRVYNLTAIRDENMFVSHHLLDSLAVADYLPEGSIIDIGSGGGLPGIPLAILWPARAVTLLDSNQKKGAFLKQVVVELDMRNVQVVIERAEKYHPAHPFEVVISRALASLSLFVDLAGHLRSATGVIVAMKGRDPAQEISDLPAAWKVVKNVPLAIPQLAVSRHLVFLRPGRAIEPPS